MDNYGEFLIYQAEDGLTNIEVKIEDETVWLSQQQMADLFQTSRTNVVEHIKHIYEEGELDKNSTCQNFRQVRKEGNRYEIFQDDLSDRDELIFHLIEFMELDTFSDY